MDGRGRAIDNVFIERLWRSVKYEEVYLKDYTDGWDAEASLATYFRFYNDERIHQALATARRPKCTARGAAAENEFGEIRASAAGLNGCTHIPNPFTAARPRDLEGSRGPPSSHSHLIQPKAVQRLGSTSNGADSAFALRT